jgi:hypothetical protein
MQTQFQFMLAPGQQTNIRGGKGEPMAKLPHAPISIFPMLCRTGIEPAAQISEAGKLVPDRLSGVHQPGPETVSTLHHAPDATLDTPASAAPQNRHAP